MKVVSIAREIASIKFTCLTHEDIKLFYKNEDMQTIYKQVLENHSRISRDDLFDWAKENYSNIHYALSEEAKLHHEEFGEILACVYQKKIVDMITIELDKLLKWRVLKTLEDNGYKYLYIDAIYSISRFVSDGKSLEEYIQYYCNFLITRQLVTKKKVDEDHQTIYVFE